MLQNERQRKILSELDTAHAVKVGELAQQMGISESTIRRDINELDQLGKLKKVFGGAVSIGRDMVFEEKDMAARNQINAEEKERIAQYAASLIQENDFVFLDAGTTTKRMIRYLENKKVTYVTNGLSHAMELIQRGFSVYMIGGLLRPSTEGTVGAAAVDVVRQYNFTKCFMGANGVDLKRGYTNLDISEAAVKTAVMKQSGKCFVLADHDKFGRVLPVRFADLEDACVITDKLENSLYRQHTRVLEAGEVQSLQTKG